MPTMADGGWVKHVDGMKGATKKYNLQLFLADGLFVPGTKCHVGFVSQPLWAGWFRSDRWKAVLPRFCGYVSGDSPKWLVQGLMIDTEARTDALYAKTHQHTPTVKILFDLGRPGGPGFYACPSWSVWSPDDHVSLESEFEAEVPHWQVHLDLDPRKMLGGL